MSAHRSDKPMSHINKAAALPFGRTAACQNSSHYEKEENLLPVGCLIGIDFVHVL
jgi:hypothetical protein